MIVLNQWGVVIKGAHDLLYPIRADFIRGGVILSMEETLESILFRLGRKTGACLFEISPPDGSQTHWEISAYMDGRFSKLGVTILEAARRLETTMVEELNRERD